MSLGLQFLWPWSVLIRAPFNLLQAYDRCMPADVLRGIRGVDELRAKYGLRDAGLHGAVIEHLDVPEALHTAVDVIGGEGGRAAWKHWCFSDPCAFQLGHCT